MSKLPDNEIVVSKGVVQSVKEYTLCNGAPFNTIAIERTPEGFLSKIGDPGHGGRVVEGKNLSDVLGGLHDKVKAKYGLLFGMKKATIAKLRRAYRGYTVRVL